MPNYEYGWHECYERSRRRPACDNAEYRPSYCFGYYGDKKSDWTKPTPAEKAFAYGGLAADVRIPDPSTFGPSDSFETVMSKLGLTPLAVPVKEAVKLPLPTALPKNETKLVNGSGVGGSYIEIEKAADYQLSYNLTYANPDAPNPSTGQIISNPISAITPIAIVSWVTVESEGLETEVVGSKNISFNAYRLPNEQSASTLVSLKKGDKLYLNIAYLDLAAPWDDTLNILYAATLYVHEVGVKRAKG